MPPCPLDKVICVTKGGRVLSPTPVLKRKREREKGGEETKRWREGKREGERGKGGGREKERWIDR